MKKWIACILLAFALCFASALCESEDAGKALKEKYEASTAFQAAQTICRVGTDELSKWACDRVVKRPGAAWDRISKFDAGWFSDIHSSTYLDMRSENWKQTDETHFECDVYGVNRIVFAIESKTVDFCIGYHLCFVRTDAYRDTWLVEDFSNLLIPAEVEKAERLSAVDPGIRVECVTGKSFRGYMMIVEDPSRLFVGTTDSFDSSRGGWRVNELAKKYGALVTINGGAFEDSGKNKNGAKPAGYVVSQGEVKSYNAYNNTGCNVVMGFDADNKLHVGRFTNDQLFLMKLRDALAFHPALIVDGKAVAVSEKNAEYTARTAIGQDKEGRVLLLVCQGRQPDCLGASYADLQEVMAAYGAVNAGNLDGGNSSAMFFNGESVYSAYPLDVSRRMPAAFMVRP